MNAAQEKLIHLADGRVIYQRDYRACLGRYATGVTIITTTTEENEPVGLTCNSFVSISMDPPLVSWSIDKGAGLREVFDKSGRFNVNILASDQSEICMLFASKKADRFANAKYHMTEFNQPSLEGCMANLDCIVQSVYDEGDHIVYIGEVCDAVVSEMKTDPLVFYGGKFRQLQAAE